MLADDGNGLAVYVPQGDPDKYALIWLLEYTFERGVEMPYTMCVLAEG